MSSQNFEKVSIIVGTLNIGGAERVAVNLSSGLAENGYDVDLVVIKSGGDLEEQVSSQVNLIQLEASRVRWSIPSIVKYLNKNKPEIVIPIMTTVNVFSIISTMLSHASPKVIITEHAEWDPTMIYNIPTRFNLMLGKITYKFADEIVAVSDDVADDVSKWANIPREHMTKIHNPIDISHSYKMDDSIHHWFNEEEPVIISAGRYSESKDFKTLIKSFNILLERKSAKLIILGDGELRRELEKYTKKLSIEDRVCLYGFVKNPHPYMSASDVFVLSSSSEGFGNVLVEAMSCGTPVVSTNCSSGPEIILDGGNYGPLVPVGEAKILAEAIIDVLEDPADSEQLRKRAKKFSIKNTTPKYEGLFKLQ